VGEPRDGRPHQTLGEAERRGQGDETAQGNIAAVGGDRVAAQCDEEGTAAQRPALAEVTEGRRDGAHGHILNDTKHSCIATILVSYSGQLRCHPFEEPP